MESFYTSGKITLGVGARLLPKLAEIVFFRVHDLGMDQFHGNIQRDVAFFLKVSVNIRVATCRADDWDVGFRSSRNRQTSQVGS